MRELLQANIRNSIRVLASISAESGQVSPKTGHEGQAASFPRDPPSFWPTFWNDNGRICCEQAEYFGFYALRAALRGCFLAPNHLSASVILLQHELFSPAVLASYTAAFHALHAFLALHGRTIVDTPARSRGSGQGDASRSLVIAVLTRNNEWTFEGEARTHKAQWLQLKQVWAAKSATIPGYFEELFDYLFHGVWEHPEGLTRSEQLVAVLEGRIKREELRPRLRQHLDGFLSLIAEIRHLAVYCSFGEDPGVVEALVNRDTFSTAGIEKQAQELVLFASRFLTDVASELCAVIRSTEVPQALRTKLYLAVHLPWFDQIQLAKCPDCVRAKVATLRDWLRPED
jgi:hypothetical protein